MDKKTEDMTMEEIEAALNCVNEKRQVLKEQARALAAVRAVRLREQHVDEQVTKLKLSPEEIASLSARAQRVCVKPFEASALVQEPSATK